MFEHVGAANALPDAVREVAQHGVADGVAMRIVDAFEMVEVEK